MQCNRLTGNHATRINGGAGIVKFIVPGRALVDYEPKAAKDSDLVEALLDGIITSTQETVAEVRKLNQKLDKSAKERSRERNG